MRKCPFDRYVYRCWFSHHPGCVVRFRVVANAQRPWSVSAMTPPLCAGNAPARQPNTNIFISSTRRSLRMSLHHEKNIPHSAPVSRLQRIVLSAASCNRPNPRKRALETTGGLPSYGPRSLTWVPALVRRRRPPRRRRLRRLRSSTPGAVMTTWRFSTPPTPGPFSTVPQTPPVFLVEARAIGRRGA